MALDLNNLLRENHFARGCPEAKHSARLPKGKFI